VDDEDWYQVGLDDQIIYELTCQSAASPPANSFARASVESIDAEQAAREAGTISDEIEILARRGRGEAAVYLVKWHGVDQPTWEAGEDLENDGWEDWVLKFNSQPKKRQPSALELVEKGIRRSIARIESHCFAELNYRLSAFGRPHVTLHSVYPRGNAYFNPDVYWPTHKERIAKALYQAGMKATHIQYIVKPSLARQWHQLWLRGCDLPLMVVHRPSVNEVPRVLEKGLEHPCIDKRRLPLYVEILRDSLSEGMDSGYVLVCASLVGNSYKVNTKISNFVVVDDAKRVLPCYLVKVESIGDRNMALPEDYPLYDPLAAWPPHSGERDANTSLLEQLDRMSEMLLKKANLKQSRRAVARKREFDEHELPDWHTSSRQRLIDVTRKDATKNQLRKAKNTQKGDFRKQSQTSTKAKTRG
jgi:hypothetical protein